MKYVYFFGAGKAEGKGDMRDLLGGKGAGLAEMTRIGLPVPAGFTITTEACDYYLKHDHKYPKELRAEVAKNLARLEKLTKKKLGDAKDPLLVSVRSGSARSMPGMMETILNLGLNDKSVEGLAKATKNDRFAWDAYRRFVQMYSSVVIGLPKEDLEARLRKMKDSQGVKDDTQVSAEGWRQLVGEYKAYFKEKTGKDFPRGSHRAALGRHRRGLRVVDGRKGRHLSPRGENHRPARHRRQRRADGLRQHGRRFRHGRLLHARSLARAKRLSSAISCSTRRAKTWSPASARRCILSELKKLMPKVYKQLEKVREKLEKHYRDMQDMEFTVEGGKLYMLQTRTGKRSPAATFHIAVDMANEKLIKEEALERIKSEDIERLFYPVLDVKIQRSELASRKIAEGINAVPGAAVGKAVFTAHEAEEWAARGEKVILVRRETSPEDVGGMYVAQGILTATGGKTSHAAVVARGWGKCCIVGAEKLDIDAATKKMSVERPRGSEGEWITLDGGDGSVYTGEIDLVAPRASQSLRNIDEVGRQGAHTRRPHQRRHAARRPRRPRNGRRRHRPLPHRAHVLQGFRAPREEHRAPAGHPGNDPRRHAEARRKALAKLLPFQRRDFIGIFEAMDGFPVTIRLIDPPLHEFVPHDADKQAELAKNIGISAETCRRRVEQLHEANPMLGHRGCRLCDHLSRKFLRCRCARSSKRPSIARSGELKCYLRSCIRSCWTKRS